MTTSVAPPRYSVPNGDLYQYLIGCWKRSLEWREFGGSYRHVHTSNTVVLIEEERAPSQKPEPGARYLRWSFGKSLNRNHLRFAYVMKFTTNPKTGETHMEWEIEGAACHAKYMPGAEVAVFNFFLGRSSTIVVTYRAMDTDKMAVCIMEVDANLPPTIQYGNMSRLNPEHFVVH